MNFQHLSPEIILTEIKKLIEISEATEDEKKKCV